MARDRLALILESMAANKGLKTPHYKIYLCIFSGLQEGIYHSVESISRLTKIKPRTLQRTIKELLETGNIQKDSNGFISLTFWSGFPAKIQKIGSVQKIESVFKGDKSEQGDDKSEQNDEETQSMLYHVSNTKKQDHVNIDLETDNKKHVKHDTRVMSLDPRNEDLMRPDIRFKKLIDALFVVYEKETKEKLNPFFTKSDAAMIKRLLKSLPEEKTERLVVSFRNFLQTNDGFDADHIRTTGVVRFWTSRFTKYLPKREVDIKKIYDKMRQEMD